MPNEKNLTELVSDPGLTSRVSADIAKERVWDDKEVFLRKTFNEDPKKGCELLFKLYYQPLCNHAVRFVSSKEIAQDIVSDIFYTFWQKQLHLTVISSFRAYLFIATQNRSLKYLRKNIGKIDSSADLMELEHVSPQHNPHQVIQFNEMSLKIDNAIKVLAPQRQKVFLMNRFDGKKYQQIADELKISLKTVEAHMSKALESLRRTLRDEIIILIGIIFFV